MSDLKSSNLSKRLKDIFWPIEGSEVKLFLPLGLMMLCMLFNFASLRSVKDSLVVPNIGAEVISFLKLWLVLPSTVIFTIIYAKLSNKFDHERVFYIIVSFFLFFLFLFAYVIFPNQCHYHPDESTISQLVEIYPNFKWFLKIFGKWSYALMYVLCELWSVVIINLLFWQYVNSIFDSKSAKRFYPFLGAVGNIGLILAGNILINSSDTSNVSDSVTLGLYATDLTFQCNNVLKPVINWVILAGLSAMALYCYIHRYVLRKTDLKEGFFRREQTKKTSLSIKESIKLLSRSKYLGHIALLVLCYGLLINILEGPWKSKVRELYPNTVDYMNFMGQFNIWMGVSCVSFMIIGSNVLRRTSWLCSALITPYMIFFTGIIFFSFVIIANYFDFGVNWFNPIYYAVIIGALQNILSKSTKYSLFDSTKEMAYLPLSLELKTKGKAAVEVIGLKFGKSLGAFTQSFIFILMPMASFDSIATYLLVIFVLIISLWIWNVKKLNIEYQKFKQPE
ncbi:MAG: hypothetical protein DGJ47_001113 [Rickettsiaceae bacterium]